MITLSNGFQKPEDGDKGQEVFDALESNIQQTNDHTHDGSNSNTISSYNISKTSILIVAANWGNQTNGEYYQDVALPSPITFTSVIANFRDTDTNENLALRYVRLTDNSIRVYCNDSSKNVTIVLG